MKDLLLRFILILLLSITITWNEINTVSAELDNSISLTQSENKTATEKSQSIHFTSRIPLLTDNPAEPWESPEKSAWSGYRKEFYGYLHYASEPLYIAQKGLFLINTQQQDMDENEYENALEDLKTRVQNRVSEFEKLASPEGFERVKSTFRQNNSNIISLLDTFKEKKVSLYQERRTQVKSDRLKSLKVFRDALQQTNAPKEVIEEIEAKIKLTQKKLSL